MPDFFRPKGVTARMLILFAAIVLLIYAALVAYIGWSGYRWLRPIAPSRRFKWLYAALLLFLATSFIFGQLSGLSILGKIGAYWMAVLFLLTFLIPLAHLTVLMLRLLRLPHRRADSWAGAAVLFLLIVLLAYGSHQAYSPVVRAYEIRIEKEVPGLNTLSIALASDTHFGLLSGRTHAERLVREINRLEPDLVLLAGDIVDNDIRPFREQGIAEVLSEIKAAYGVYASLGNHDRHGGPMAELIGALEEAGMEVLYDEVAEVGGKIVLAGRKDRTDRGREPLSALLGGVDRAKPVILLDHQPVDLEDAEREGVDLMVSGHTHRGQIFPGSLITARIYENDWGLLRKGRMHSVVSSGFGFWGPPIRLGTRSELVHLVVTFGGNDHTG